MSLLHLDVKPATAKPTVPKRRSSRFLCRPPHGSGFTLTELMIGVALSSLIVLGIYYIYSTSTATYRVQDQVLQAMDQARFALSQLQRDISAAGLLATPNSTNDSNVCPKPINQDLRGIVFRLEGARDQDGGAARQPMAPVSVTMFGSFWSTNIYYTRSINGTTVRLQDLADGAPYPTDQVEFDQIFRPGRMVRIVNAEQFEMYYPIASADFGTRTLVLAQPVATTTPPDFCGVQGFGVGLEINPVGYVRYVLRADPAEAGKVDLLREELDATDPALDTVMASSTIRVAEYVADLQFYDFAVDTDVTGRAPLLGFIQNPEGVIGAGVPRLDMDVRARPQDLRFVTAKVTTRTRDEDERFFFRPRQNLHDPLEAYELDRAMVGAARTVTLATRIPLDSFAVRNVK
jgi:prepilin-type N-terminal cleavage/methylation domain-containing protein